MINIHNVSAPVWRALPAQRLRPEATLSLNLNNYITGIPTPSIAFNGTPTGNAANATLLDGILTWVIPDTYTADEAQTFNFTATNSEGMTNATLTVNVLVDTAPSWSVTQTTITVTEGDIDDSYDFAPLLSGIPQPTLSLDEGAAHIPARMSFEGTRLLITPTSNFISPTSFTFDVIATNNIEPTTENANEISVTLRILPTFTDDEDIVFTVDDYEEIRKLVDSKLTIQQLADEIIQADTIIGAAITWGITTMPIDQSNPRSLEQLKSKRRAIIYRAAGILATAVRRSQDPRLTVLEINEQELQESLFMQADLHRQIANDDLLEREEAILDTPFIIINP